MHSALNRAQSVFGFFTTLAALLGFLTAVSIVLYPAEPVASVELADVQVVRGRPHYYATKREEYAQIRFDLDADLSSLFNWNTKQLFVYVLATYPPASPALSASDASGSNLTEAIVWDTIIRAPESPYSFPSLKDRYLSSIPFLSSSKSKRSNSNSKSNNKDKSKKSSSSSSSSSSAPTTPGILKLRNQKSKYHITDISGQLAERSGVNLVVGWNVQPWIGALQWNPGTKIANNFRSIFGFGVITGGSGGRSKAFDFPALKGPNAESSQSSA